MVLFNAATAFADDPEGVVFDPAMQIYSVGRTPTRSLEEVLKSFASWRHQVLADASTADYVAEDGILSMECSACGQNRPSAIEIEKMDLRSVMAYEAGHWNIGIRSIDGTQDFRGVLRGEIGAGPHEAARLSENKRVALIALQDLYDLGYLAQNTGPAAAPRKVGAPTAATTPPAPVIGPAAAPAPAPTPAAAGPKSGAASLATLAAAGDIEKILEQQRARRGSGDAASALETAYAARARTHLLAGEVDAALQTLAAGRQKFGKSPLLRDREVHYVVIGDAYDRLRWGVKLDVAGLQGYLAQISALEPGDAQSIQTMLAQILAHRIADQRAAGRDTIADELLTSGRSLFPDQADLLMRGRAGALPAGGIEVGVGADK